MLHRAHRGTAHRPPARDLGRVPEEYTELQRNLTGFVERSKTVAYVDVNAHGELMKFAETVANNRGVPMNLFASVAEAEAWLAGLEH